jgi:hypothetical protein
MINRNDSNRKCLSLYSAATPEKIVDDVLSLPGGLAKRE